MNLFIPQLWDVNSRVRLEGEFNKYFKLFKRISLQGKQKHIFNIRILASTDGEIFTVCPSINVDMRTLTEEKFFS